jgi:ferredoxin
MAVSAVLRVNPIACDAHGVCAELFPEWVQLDDWGYPIVSDAAIPEELMVHARRVVNACPKAALLLDEVRERAAPRP